MSHGASLKVCVVQEGRIKSGRGGEGVRDCLNFLNLRQKRWLEKLEREFSPFQVTTIHKITVLYSVLKMNTVDGLDQTIFSVLSLSPW